jgi:PAS domain S-box-containing protein
MASTAERENELIRVLHVDDTPEILDLSATMLQRADDQFIIETATSASGGRDQLADSTFDCIISDYDMPGQTGIEFLEIVREEYPDLPFILYTGKGSEEIASDAISAGVTDYLQKETGTEQYTVLANRIRNAVELDRSEQALAERQAELERKDHAMDAAPVAITISDTSQDDNPLIYVNDHFTELTGYTEEEVLGSNCRFLQGEETSPEPVARIRAAIDNKESVTVELRNYRKDGTECWNRFSIAPVRGDDGKATNHAGPQQDVTKETDSKNNSKS